MREGGCYVCGIDTNVSTLHKARKLASDLGIQSSDITFVERATPELRQTFDVVISQNAMEHFPNPVGALDEMKSLIHRDGKILITFGPPWLAPYGSHMHFFCKVPWMNLIFSETTVMNVRALYRHDAAKRYEDVESGLNKMTVTKFEGIVSQSGLRLEYKKYSCIKRLDWMGSIPLLRELVVNHVSCILTLPTR